MRRKSRVSADQLQRIAFRNSLEHGVTMNFDAILEAKDGNITVVEMKSAAGMTMASAKQLFLGAGTSRVLLVEGASERLLTERLLLHLDRTDFKMPNVAQMLLPFILSRKLRDAVEGDLTEDFGKYITKWGRTYALRWLWWELALLAARRFGPAGVITALAMWFRQKLGW